MVRTMVQTPLLNGFSFNAGLFDLTFGAFRPFLTSWLTVGISDFLTPLRSLSVNKKPCSNLSVDRGIRGDVKKCLTSTQSQSVALLNDGGPRKREAQSQTA
jgi:hypothetical protein